MADYSKYFENQLRRTGQYCEQDISQMEIPESILKLVDEDSILHYHIIPVGMDDDTGRLIIATDTEQTFKVKSDLEIKLCHKIKLVYVNADNLKMAAVKFYNIQYFQENSNYMLQNIDTDMTPLKGAINAMLQDAARRKASDIHLLPQFRGYRVVFRINGHAYDMTAAHEFSENQMTNVASLIKQMDTSGSSDTTKTNMPNEGSFYIAHGGQDVFVRLETLPEGNGKDRLETIIIRLQPQAGKQNTHRKGIDDIGYTEADLREIKQVLYSNPTGLFIISGPTGSGKTTSLHAQIHYVLDTFQEPLNVMEIAEPIEIYEDEFTQIQVRKADSEANNLPSEKILEAILRADPDIIMYNEIRNAKDATVATVASNTGHLVFSTVHANDCTSTVLRLLDFDISKVTLLAELRIIMAQRLIATLCPYCKKRHILTEQEKTLLSKDEFSACKDILFEKADKMTAANCPHCVNGISGRTAIVEYIVFNHEIRDTLLEEKYSFRKIEQILRKQGFKSMWEKGIDLVAAGDISLSDLIRATGRETVRNDIQ